MTRRPSIAMALAISVAMMSGTMPARADDFGRLEGKLLAELPEGPIAQAHESLTIRELAALPSVLEGTRAALLIVRTDQGNPSRLLVSAGFRKGAIAPGEVEPELIPILILERFATFQGGGGSAPDRLAEGRGVMLFDGFRYDLDTGQVVPEGVGGDVRYLAESDENGPIVRAIHGATLYTLTEPPSFPDPGAGEPSPGRTILPGDYAGRYRLFADGTLSGTLDLEVDDRTVTGRFRSDETGTAYPVRGEVAGGNNPSIGFAILYPRTRQDYTGRLFSEGKGAMAGTVVMLDRDRAFFAIREGGRVAPEGVEERERPDSPDPEAQPDAGEAPGSNPR